MVNAAIADVICPAVAAEGPHALSREEIGIFTDKVGIVIRMRSNSCKKPIRCSAGCFRVFRIFKICRTFLRCDTMIAQCTDMSKELCAHALLPHQEAKGILGSILKQTHCPCRSPAAAVCTVWRGRHGAAVCRRAARGIGNIHVIAEQLCHQLDIGRLPASRACAGEFKVRLGKLGIFHTQSIHRIPLHHDTF